MPNLFLVVDVVAISIPLAGNEVVKTSLARTRCLHSNQIFFGMGQCLFKNSPEPSRTEEVADSDKEGDSGTSQTRTFGLQKFFETKRLLGEGGSGETWLMKDKKTDEHVAVKLIPRPIPKALHKMLLQEISIQRDLGAGHFNIVTSKEVILTPSHLAFVLEYVSGGTLTKYVSDRWCTVSERGGLFLGEDEARYFFKVRMHLLMK